MTPQELDGKVGKKIRWHGQELYFNDWYKASDGNGGTKIMVVVSSGHGPIAIGNNAPLEELDFGSGKAQKEHA